MYHLSRSSTKTSDLKRLFAESGNLCAFPKCTHGIIDGSSMIGEVCHIKGANIGSARFDSTESNELLNSHKNLILLCRNHHKTIDDDEVSYTVDRLQQMKANHIKNSNSKISDSEANLLTRIFLENNASSTNQSGGITAQTINTQSVHVHASTSVSIPTRTVNAIEVLWTAILSLEKEFGTLIVLHSVLTQEEIKSLVESNGRNDFASGLVEEFRHQ